MVTTFIDAGSPGGVSSEVGDLTHQGRVAFPQSSMVYAVSVPAASRSYVPSLAYVYSIR